jgi:hypothetical protein
MTTTPPDLDQMGLPELLGRLRDVNTLRTPLGWPTEEAVTKRTVERRILDLVLRRDPAPNGDPAEQVMCEVEVKAFVGERPAFRVPRASLMPGGLFLETDSDVPIDEPIELEIMTQAGQRTRARGNVIYRSHGKAGHPAGVAVGFTRVAGDSAERRLVRLIFELIRNRVG